MATIGDVARAAGVSVSTVSYALSGKRPISEPTRARVAQAVRELGFRPHAGARALASSRTRVLALIVPLRPSVDMSIITGFVSGITSAAGELEHDVLLLTRDDSAGLARVSSSARADAVIVMDVEAHDARLPALRALHQPAVLIGVPAEPGGLSCVDLDFTAAGRLAVEHLAGLGHRRIGLIGASAERVAAEANYALRMRDGVLAGAAATGTEAVLVPSEPTMSGGQRALAELLDREPRTSGVVVHNEAALPGVLMGLRARGLQVPADLSLITVSPLSLVPRLQVPLTVIEVPSDLIGRMAVQMAVGRLAGEQPAELRLVRPELVPGASTTAPRA